MTTLLWPVRTQQGMVQGFDPATGVIEFHAPPGTEVLASCPGRAAVVGADSLHLAGDQLNIVYLNIENIRVQPGQNVALGAVIAQARGPESITVIVYKSVDPRGLFEKPAPPNAPPGGDTTKIHLRPTMDGVRLREKPVDGFAIAQLKSSEVVESLEAHAETLAKLGVNGQWLHVRRLDGLEGYAAAWFLARANPPSASPTVRVMGRSLAGMNLDINHPLGRPSPQDLQSFGWIRLKFNLSLNPDRPEGDPARYGNTDVNAAFNHYRPFIEHYARAGLKTLMVFTHQLYGEGAGFHWQQMDDGRWRQLIGRYADYARQVALRFAGSGLVHAYQIWNEQDTKEGRAAVAVPAQMYGVMLTETIRAVRSVDFSTPIITGGHTSGPDAGSAYIRAALRMMAPDVRPDGIASHPYGRGVAGHRFSNWGPLDEEIKKFGAVLPGAPIWLTEWGVLDHQGRPDVIPVVADYAAGFMDMVQNQHSGQVATAVWYAWADSMDNGFGLVDAGGRPKTALLDCFKKFA